MDTRLKAKARLLGQAFNITIEDWDKIFKHQHNQCFICQRPILPPRRPHTDHSHKTGLIRGILCSQCNRALGKVEDPRWQWTWKHLLRAAMYMQSPPAVGALGREVFGFPGKIGTKRYKAWLKQKSRTDTNH